MSKYCCDNCERVFNDQAELKEVKDLMQRVDEGGPMPSGECPDCGALVYIVESEVTTTTATAKLLAEFENSIIPLKTKPNYKKAKEELQRRIKALEADSKALKRLLSSKFEPRPVRMG